MPCGDGESDPETPASLRAYPQRWYMLIVFSCFAWSQGLGWAIWGPVATATKAVFGFSADDTALLLNWTCIFFVLLAAPFAYFLDRSLRWATVVSVALQMTGATLRVVAQAAFPNRSVEMEVCMHISSILNAAAGPVAMGAVSKLTQEWFPSSERGFAAAIAAEANLAGAASAFLIGPSIASEDGTSSEMMRLWMVLAAPGVLLCPLVVYYFPSAPPSPPSMSAKRQTDAGAWTWSMWWGELTSLMKNLQFCVLCVAFGLLLGVYTGWVSVMEINLATHGFSQMESGVIGFASVMAGAVGGVIAGIASGRIPHLKVGLLALMVVASVASLLFALAFVKTEAGEAVVAPSTSLLVSAASVIGFAAGTSVPLFFELTAETTYPSAEGVLGVALTTMYNGGSMLFLFVPIDRVGTNWMNWTMLAVCIATMVCLCSTRIEYHRREVDRVSESSSTTAEWDGTNNDDNKNNNMWDGKELDADAVYGVATPRFPQQVV